jgi:large subunit ribosomal protein L25
MPMLKVSTRTEKGKGPAKRARKNGVIPAVIYAHGEKTRELAVKEKDFLDVLDEIKGKVGLIDMQIEDEASVKCLVKMVQRHSTTLQVAHIDFQRIHADEKVTISLPIHLVGSPVGLKMGGLLEHTLRALPVRGLPANIPPSITLDIANLKVGQSLHVSDVKLDTVEVQLPLNTPIVSVLVPKKIEEAAPAAAEAAAAPVEGEGPKEPEVIAEKKTEERAAERAKAETTAKGGKPAKEEKKEEKGKKEEKKK